MNGGTPVTTCDVIRFEINDGAKKRPLYLGCLPAEELNRLCIVPSFSATTGQEEIAGNVLQPPIKDWQRPLITAKSDRIMKRYDRVGEFMPNPVLLSVGNQDGVKVQPKTIDGNATGLYTLTIDIEQDKGAPLLVLDGQHRINGLARGTKKSNPIPFVLLFSEKKGVYPPQDSAKIFAEVSTESTALKELHREWMQYAFELDSYDPITPGGEDNRKSMEVAAFLCHERTFGSGKSAVNNPFLDAIQFNPELPAKPAIGKGLTFNAVQVKGFALDEYYRGSPIGGKHLDPKEVAEQIALASLALQNSLGTPLDESVFFGRVGKFQQYMEHAFVRAVLAKLLDDSTPHWSAIFSKMGMSMNIWDFSPWVKTTGGNDGNTSRKVAREVMIESVKNAAVPHGSSTLVEYLQGDNAQIVFIASFVNSDGRKLKKGSKSITYAPGSVRTISLGGRKHLKIDDSQTTSNIGKIDIFDDDAKRSKDFTFSSLKRGVKLDRQVRLNVEARYYGGISDAKVITIDPN